ncbi:hypothetical protein DMN91_006151, partial [Ooceraea biroi]
GPAKAQWSQLPKTWPKPHRSFNLGTFKVLNS